MATPEPTDQDVANAITRVDGLLMGAELARTNTVTVSRRDLVLVFRMLATLMRREHARKP